MKTRKAKFARLTALLIALTMLIAANSGCTPKDGAVTTAETTAATAETNNTADTALETPAEAKKGELLIREDENGDLVLSSSLINAVKEQFVFPGDSRFLSVNTWNDEADEPYIPYYVGVYDNYLAFVRRWDNKNIYDKIMLKCNIVKGDNEEVYLAEGASDIVVERCNMIDIWYGEVLDRESMELLNERIKKVIPELAFPKYPEYQSEAGGEEPLIYEGDDGELVFTDRLRWELARHFQSERYLVGNIYTWKDKAADDELFYFGTYGKYMAFVTHLVNDSSLEAPVYNLIMFECNVRTDEDGRVYLSAGADRLITYRYRIGEIVGVGRISKEDAELLDERVGLVFLDLAKFSEAWGEYPNDYDIDRYRNEKN